MKNLFNNISQEERNRILEMHSGKKNVISEQNQVNPKNSWSEIEKGLVGFKTPKVIRARNTYGDNKPFTSLNWGSHKEKGKHNWGVSISSYDYKLKFTTTDEIQSKIFKNVTGITPDLYGKYWSSSEYKLDPSNPSKVISVVKNLIDSLE